MLSCKTPVDLSVVIPAYLEEENLRLLLPRLRLALSELTPSYEVIVVDTEAPLDDTSSVVRDAGFTYVNRRGSNAFGQAVRTGIAEAKGTYLIFMDADGSHSPEFVGNLWQHRLDYDVVIASRYVEGGHTENKRLLVLMSRMLNWTYSFFLSLDCQDVSNSFKLYRSDQLKPIQLRCDNFDIVEEILVKMNRRKRLRIKEVPFTFKQRLFGETKRSLLLFIISYARTLFRLRFQR